MKNELSRYIEPSSSDLNRHVVVIGDDKYLHGIYTEVDDEFDILRCDKTFVIYLKNKSQLYLCLYDKKNNDIINYFIEFLDTRYYLFDKSFYGIDHVNIKICDSVRRLNDLIVVGYGKYRRLINNIDIELMGVRLDLGDKKYFKYRYRTAHNEFAYDVNDVKCELFNGDACV